MEKKTLAILTAIVDCSVNGEPVIIEKEELLATVTKECGTEQSSFNEVDEVIKELSLAEFLKIRYKDDNQYCIIPLPKAQLVVENNRNKLAEKNYNAINSLNVNIDYKKIAKVTFRAAFTGGLLGGLIALIIFFIADYIL